MTIPQQAAPQQADTSDDATTFPPSPEFVADAVADQRLHDAASADRVAFWAEQSRALLDWRTPFTTTLDWSGATATASRSTSRARTATPAPSPTPN
jgi:acetyl-CoA synthetase